MNAIIKNEPMDENAFEARILAMVMAERDGLSNPRIVEILTSDDLSGEALTQRMVVALNSLRHKNKIDFFMRNDILHYKYDANAAEQSRHNPAVDNLNNEERIVYKCIERAQRSGISDKDIMDRSNIKGPIFTKIVKSLETKKLIKQIKTKVRRKTYMLIDLEPDESVTGGVFFGQQGFDTEFVELVTNFCLRKLRDRVNATQGRDLDIMELRNSQFLSTLDILNLINDSRISRVRLNLPDIELIMDTLLFDGKVEKNVIIERDQSTQTNLFRATSSFIHSSGLVYTPCGRCPVKNDCRPGNVISPEKCEYMLAWLDF